MKIQKIRMRHTIYPRIGLSRADKDGGPVLKGEPFWKNINGFFFRAKGSTIWVEFRRY